ncbi:maltose alpha-D-glucosyltransferase [Actinophytocola oryzae]|uniref:maltose alpha-D-glucosyltransferase n=1 Tax=Actinophytocola oryzae TaxID=502181 RepID=A0A4V6Q6V6_9PSEU|nr:maltose alpha-D-glucosyltransferase [Actinophytocola oryzae]TDV52441.1 trehalose synthase [Actinophytocola oryzae]
MATTPEADPLGTARRRALAVATGRYRHDELPDLDSPAQDAEIARRILGNPAIGDFSPFTVLLNNDVHTLTNQVYDFFHTAETDEFLFAYFSCHGRRDSDGRLYLAAIDTEPGRLPPTAIAADDIRDWVDNCRARSVVVVLDCCHAGAFGGEPKQRSMRDRVVLLTAGATELAHEGSSGKAKATPSAFARAFFEGLETGLADRNLDGAISVREAFDYANGQLANSEIKQHPQMRANVVGDLVLCRTPPNPGRLSRDLESLVRNGFPAARLLAVEQLAQWLGSAEPAQARTAEATLVDLAADPDEHVAAAAGRVLNNQQPVLVSAGARPAGAEPDPNWYARAVFYEVRVRTFRDSNGDGVGDLPGLVKQLDYLRWLGVDCLLLTPIYDSPLHDDGYDISDFTSVHPDLGTVGDLVELLDQAHARGIRVVLDVVLNHTSTAHDWFQKSRTDPTGPYGDFYVWQDTDEGYTDASMLGEDQEDVRWTFDRARRQYYWHRFADHEPDLNFDNPAVQDAMIAALRSWLDLGVDGFRLLTAPYLFERDGTPCEGLGETHEYLAAVRREIDKNYRERVLIAWADRWPSDAVEYFGNDPANPECHVVLYSSLMPRVFLSIRQENHEAISAVLAESRGVPENCQWGIFLRNGDEMTLDLVDPDERRYLLREYAPLRRMHNSRGIRRRLAPLHNGKPDQLGFCIALLLSLPGAPILYYGDEIGMGENLSLPGTAAIRTPMQWSSDRAGGFSDAEYEELASPVVLDSIYGYQSINVESQLRQPTSLLRTVRQLIEIRRHSPALTTGSFRQLDSDNPAIWCYVRTSPTEEIVCVANFSGYPQATQLDLSRFAGRYPVEVTGGVRFPDVRADTPYQVTLSGNRFYWLRMVEHEKDQGGQSEIPD